MYSVYVYATHGPCTHTFAPNEGIRISYWTLNEKKTVDRRSSKWFGQLFPRNLFLVLNSSDLLAIRQWFIWLNHHHYLIHRPEFIHFHWTECSVFTPYFSVHQGKNITKSNCSLSLFPLTVKQEHATLKNFQM